MDKKNNTTEWRDIPPDVCESDKRHKLEELCRTVRQGFEQIERGQYTEYASGKKAADKIIAEGLKRAVERKRN